MHKKEDSWTNRVRVRLAKSPGSALIYDFFHPNYHNYDEHIEYVIKIDNAGCIAMYKGKTEIGKKLCIDLLSKTARQIMRQGKVGEINKAILIIDSLIESAGDDRKCALATLRDLVIHRLS
ncbi:MAG: hypothetical protein L6R48_01415 [Planctomycetes bacterium]|nr:hypothetical protein [Planctomycetota bacterium]